MPQDSSLDFQHLQCQQTCSEAFGSWANELVWLGAGGWLPKLFPRCVKGVNWPGVLILDEELCFNKRISNSEIGEFPITNDHEIREVKVKAKGLQAET